MEIKISNTSQLFLIDDEDWERIRPFNWVAHPAGYAYAWIDERMTLLHRYIMQTPNGMEVDHIHGIKWDNRKSQLRNCMPRENRMIRTEKRTLAGWRNIRLATCGYQVRFTRRPKAFHLGTYKTLEAAQQARDDYLKKTEPTFDLIKSHFHAN
mgnify:FL=1